MQFNHSISKTTTLCMNVPTIHIGSMIVHTVSFLLFESDLGVKIQFQRKIHAVFEKVHGQAA